MDSRSFTLPKGEYFVGDIEYVIPDQKVWVDVFCMNGEGDWDYKDKDYLLFKTGGDGRFFNHRDDDSQDGIPVDSGTIGIISIDVLDIEKEDISIEKLGLIYSSNHEIKVDIQGESNRTYGIHIYQKREKYSFDDAAILVVVDNEELDEDYFISKSSPFEEGEEDRCLFNYDEDDNEELQEDDNDEENQSISKRSPLEEVQIDIDLTMKEMMKNAELQEEIKQYDKLPEIESKNKELYIKRGDDKLEDQEFLQAIDDYKMVIGIDPKNAEAYAKIANAKLLYPWNYEVSGWKDLEKALKIDPKSEIANSIKVKHQFLELVNSAGKKFEEKDYEGSIRDCNKALVIDPKHEDQWEVYSLYSTRGESKFQLGDYQGLLDDYQNLDEEYGVWNGRNFWIRGFSKEKIGNKQGAMDDYIKGIEHDTEHFGAYLKGNDVLKKQFSSLYKSRGCLYKEFGKVENAIEDWKKAAELGDKEAAELLEDSSLETNRLLWNYLEKNYAEKLGLTEHDINEIVKDLKDFNIESAEKFEKHLLYADKWMEGISDYVSDLYAKLYGLDKSKKYYDLDKIDYGEFLFYFHGDLKLNDEAKWGVQLRDNQPSSSEISAEEYIANGKVKLTSAQAFADQINEENEAIMDQVSSATWSTIWRIHTEIDPELWEEEEYEGQYLEDAVGLYEQNSTVEGVKSFIEERIKNYVGSPKELESEYQIGNDSDYINEESFLADVDHAKVVEVVKRSWDKACQEKED